MDKHTISIKGKLTGVFPSSEINKVNIWGYELCKGSDWSDFLEVVNKLGKENQQLKQQLEEKEKRIHEVENTFNVSSIALADKFKKIKELKLQLAESKEENKKLVKALNGDIFINYKVPMENAKLKQQLHDLPKKIVEEIEKCFTEYLPLKYRTGAWFYGKLNEILKKFGGENE